MRLVSLNTWGGRAGEQKFLGFFGRNNDTDIFCLQEVWSAPYDGLNEQLAGGRKLSSSEIMSDGLQSLSGALSGHRAFFRPHFTEHYGLLTLVRENIDVIAEGDFFVHRHKGYFPEGDLGHHARNIQYVTMETGGVRWSVMNFHGLWNGKGKGDTEERIEQSRRIIEFLEGFDHPFVLCGDFNLLPDTESIRMLEGMALRNLVKEYGIMSTRTPLYEKPEKHADYAFVSEGIEVKDFRVLPDIVSDHSPLYLEFDVPSQR